ncbi:restriction endonuclease subunit S [Leucobacter sp. HY1910]
MSEWREVTLGEVAPLKYGKSLPEPQREPGIVPVYSSAGITGAHCSALVEGDAVIIGRKGNVGSVYFARKSSFPIDTAFYTQGSFDTNLHFLYYLLTASGLDRLSRDSAVPGLRREEYERVKALLPSLAEQRAIAEVLGALDDKIAANTRLAATADAFLRSQIDAQWLKGTDRSATLSDFVELNPKEKLAKGSSETSYIDMKRLPEVGWSIEGQDKRPAKGGARFANGDTLLARITPCLQNRKTGFVDTLNDGEIAVGSTEFIVLRSRASIAAPISFLLATESRFREFAIQRMIGTSGRQRVAASALEGFAMPAPDMSWLKEFGEQATSMFALVRSTAAENRTLAETRDALLPKLMSGQLRVRDAERIAEAAGA